MQLFYWLVAYILGLSLPSAISLSGEATVTDKEAVPAPSHHRAAATPADSGPTSQGESAADGEREKKRE